jgi:hypothetical protein
VRLRRGGKIRPLPPMGWDHLRGAARRLRGVSAPTPPAAPGARGDRRGHRPGS